MADKIAKGRQTTGEALAAPKRGERNNLAKLTEEKVRMIRSDPGTNRDVAARFGVVPSVISMVRNRRIWRHVA